MATQSPSAAAVSAASAAQTPSSNSSVGDERSVAPSPGPRFDAELLKANIRTTLQTKLGGATWDKKDKEKNRRLSTELADSVKSKMLEVEPRNFKYIVQVQLVENLGQGGRADLACHWEDSDVVVRELYANDSLICTVLAYAVRAY